MKTKFAIQGMTCSSCQTHVERAVSKLEGVKSANVNLLSNSMVVEYDETILKCDYFWVYAVFVSDSHCVCQPKLFYQWF